MLGPQGSQVSLVRIARAELVPTDGGLRVFLASSFNDDDDIYAYGERCISLQ